MPYITILFSILIYFFCSFATAEEGFVETVWNDLNKSSEYLHKENLSEDERKDVLKFLHHSDQRVRNISMSTLAAHFTRYSEFKKPYIDSLFNAHGKKPSNVSLNEIPPLSSGLTKYLLTKIIEASDKHLESRENKKYSLDYFHLINKVSFILSKESAETSNELSTNPLLKELISDKSGNKKPLHQIIYSKPYLRNFPVISNNELIEIIENPKMDGLWLSSILVPEYGIIPMSDSIEHLYPKTEKMASFLFNYASRYNKGIFDFLKTRSPLADQRLNAISLLGRTGIISVSFLDKLLDHKNDDIRLFTTSTLGSLHEFSIPALPKLINLAINDKNISVRRYALKSIGNIGAYHPDAVKVIVESLSDPDNSIKFSACESLKNFRAYAKGFLTKIRKHENSEVTIPHLMTGGTRKLSDCIKYAIKLITAN